MINEKTALHKAIVNNTVLLKTVIDVMKAISNGGFKCGRNEIEMIKTNGVLHFNVITMYELGQKEPSFLVEVYRPDCGTPIGSIAPVIDEDNGRINSWLVIRRFGDVRYMDSMTGLWEDMAKGVMMFFHTPVEQFVETYREAALNKDDKTVRTFGDTQYRTHGGHPVEQYTKEGLKEFMEEKLISSDQVIGSHFGYFELTDEPKLKNVIIHMFAVGRGNDNYTQAMLLEANGRFNRILGSFTLEDGYVNMKSALYTGERPFDSADQLFDIVNKYLVVPSRAHNTRL